MEITREAPAAAPGAPGYDLYELDAELWDGVLFDLFGNDDLGQSPLRRWAESTAPRVTRHQLVVARENGVVLGVALLELPQLDNRHIAFLSIAVRPEHRRRGVGGALFDEAAALAAEDGRHDLQAWTWDRLVAPGAGTISAAQGDGVIDPTADGAAFLLSRGFTLAQVDLMSGLTLQAQVELEQLAAETRSAVPARYSLVQWRGDTPQRWIEDAAALQVAMSTDIPTGTADLRPELVDAERVRSEDRRRREGGLDELVTAVEHNGRLVAFTRVIHDPSRPEIADQWDTLVVGAHRGNGLGLLIKTASHATLRATWPRIRRLITGNASENSWMLAINRRLGYLPVAASGWFTRKDPGHGTE